MPLTTLQVRNAKPGRHSDGKGLYLLVKPSTARSWVLRVQVGGNRRDFGLGSVLFERKAPVSIPLEKLRELTLSEARDKATMGRALVKAGLDPSIEWRRKDVVIPTLEAAAREYHAAVQKGWRSGKHGDQWINTLEQHVFKAMGGTPVNEVDAHAIQSVLMPIWLLIPETARRVRQRIGAVLDFAHSKGWRDAEAPLRAVNALMRAIRQPKKGNYEALPYSKLPALMKALRDGEPSVGRYALQFLVLTAARSGEVRGAVWSEFDMDAARWDIPGPRMKSGEAHSVPLPSPAVDILREMRGLFSAKPSEPVFPGNKGKPLSDATMAKALRVAGAGNATPHGMRSAFRDWAAERTSYPGEWAEAALSHALPNKVEAAYRRTKFFDQRRGLMDAWAEFLDVGTNVVTLADRRA